MKVSIGNLIDQLTVVNIRIWMAEDIKRDMVADDAKVAAATRIVNVANQQRHDLIQAIDEELNLIASGQKQVLYRQGSTKMYGKEKK